MRGWRLALVGAVGLLAAVAATVLAVALNAATGGTARWFPTMDRYPLWWTAGATVAVAGAGLVVWRVQGWYDRRVEELVPAVPPLESWVVDRPAEVNRIVSALRGGTTVGVTTAVKGAGGFGKTTLARMIRADPRVVRRFQGRVYWVTVGRDANKQALTGLVNGLLTQIEPDRPVTFTDARQASEHLAAVLAGGPRRLLILDDVWTDEQLAVFPVAGRCARLVTTRNPSLAAGAAVAVKVDQMSQAQARELLQRGLPPLPGAVVRSLVAETGRWPLLLRLASKILTEESRLHADITPVAKDLLRRLRDAGVLEVDQLTGTPGQQLDVTDPDQRSRAISATIEASTGLLSIADRDRLIALGVFAEDEEIPHTLVASLWRVSTGLDKRSSEMLCTQLADLALLTLVRTGDGGAIELHDVIREYLRRQLGPARLGRMHQVLLDAAAADLPAAAPARASSGQGTVTAWWELSGRARYLRDHLIEHLLAAGRADEAEAVACDLRWAESRLDQVGPVAPFADLALAGTSRARRLARLIGQAAHLLAPTDPAYSLTDILYSRVAHDPDWGSQARAMQADRTWPALVNRWALPDLPDPALRHVLTGHDGPVWAVAVAPDGTWLATGDYAGSVRIWDTATGKQRDVLTGHDGPVYAVAIAPAGTWLATGSTDRTVRIWDSTTGQQRAILTGHHGPVEAVAIAPAGTWLATGDYACSVRIWDTATGKQHAPLTGPDGWVDAVAIAPDGTWLATGSEDRTVRIWDTATGQQRGVLTGHDGPVYAVAVAPDGTWLATGSHDGTARTWDTATGQQRATLTGLGGWVDAVAVAPDGAWLATGSHDGTVRIWDSATGQQRGVLTGHDGPVYAVAVAPDSTWLVTGGVDGTARTWDCVTRRQRAVLTGHAGMVLSVAVAPGGTWLATGGDDGTARIWDTAASQHRAALTGHDNWVLSVAVAPDGTWLATGSVDGTAQIWDCVTGRQRAVLTGHDGPVGAVAVAPDGTWLAVAVQDGAVRIREAATGEILAVMRVDGTLTTCQWNPCGLSLAATGSRGVYLFTFRP